MRECLYFFCITEGETVISSHRLWTGLKRKKLSQLILYSICFSNLREPSKIYEVFKRIRSFPTVGLNFAIICADIAIWIMKTPLAEQERSTHSKWTKSLYIRSFIFFLFLYTRFFSTICHLRQFSGLGNFFFATYICFSFRCGNWIQVEHNPVWKYWLIFFFINNWRLIPKGRKSLLGDIFKSNYVSFLYK